MHSHSGTYPAQNGLLITSNQEETAGSQHPDRDEQFRYIAALKAQYLCEGVPVISVDTKKKELIGNYRREGQTWRREPIETESYFASSAKCVAVPFGIYDIAQNSGYVTVGISKHTSEFAVRCLETWWRLHGRSAYPQGDRILVLADGGGANGYNLRIWKKDLQENLCDALGLSVTVSHYPPGCSKWNPVEYRLFSHISMNWARKPLQSLQVMLAFIRGTTTTAGLIVEAQLDDGIYRKERKATERQMRELALSTHEVCPRWNYTLTPRLTSCPPQLLRRPLTYSHARAHNPWPSPDAYDETVDSAVSFLKAAVPYYRSIGVTATRVMTDNGGCYRSYAFGEACRDLGIKHIRTKPYTPRTNGKAERFIQTALREWAYANAYPTSDRRTQELPIWLQSIQLAPTS